MKHQPSSDDIVTKTFDLLSTHELYELMRLRSQTLVVERAYPYNDFDNHDQHCHHAWITCDDVIASYLRISPPSTSMPMVCISRVVTHPSHRRKGLCNALMNWAFNFVAQHFSADIIVRALTPLCGFYQGLGFQNLSQPYSVDGISQIDMIRKKVSP